MAHIIKHLLENKISVENVFLWIVSEDYSSKNECPLELGDAVLQKKEFVQLFLNFLRIQANSHVLPNTPTGGQQCQNPSTPSFGITAVKYVSPHKATGIYPTNRNTRSGAGGKLDFGGTPSRSRGFHSSRAKAGVVPSDGLSPCHTDEFVQRGVSNSSITPAPRDGELVGPDRTLLLSPTESLCSGTTPGRGRLCSSTPKSVAPTNLTSSREFGLWGSSANTPRAPGCDRTDRNDAFRRRSYSGNKVSDTEMPPGFDNLWKKNNQERTYEKHSGFRNTLQDFMGGSIDKKTARRRYTGACTSFDFIGAADCNTWTRQSVQTKLDISDSSSFPSLGRPSNGAQASPRVVNKLDRHKKKRIKPTRVKVPTEDVGNGGNCNTGVKTTEGATPMLEEKALAVEIKLGKACGLQEERMMLKRLKDEMKRTKHVDTNIVGEPSCIGEEARGSQVPSGDQAPGERCCDESRVVPKTADSKCVTALSEYTQGASDPSSRQCIVKRVRCTKESLSDSSLNNSDSISEKERPVGNDHATNVGINQESLIFSGTTSVSKTFSKNTEQIDCSPSMVTNRRSIDICADLYSKLLLYNLTPSLASELHFVFQLLTVKTWLDDGQVEPQYKSGLPDLLYSAHNCVYFAISVLLRSRHLIKLLDRSILRLLAENSRVQLFCPSLQEDLNKLAHSLPTHLSPKQTPRSPMKGVPFQIEIDNRSSFPDNTTFHVFKKQRDIFYELLREWECEHESPDWSFSYCLGDAIRSLLQLGPDPCNTAHLARLFVAQLLCACESGQKELKQPDDGDVLSALKRRQPEKFERLQERLVTPSSTTSSVNPAPSFPGVQQFFKDFIMEGASPSFSALLEEHLIAKISDLLCLTSNRRESPSSSQSSLLLRQVGVLGKFLGLLWFAPYCSPLTLPQLALAHQVTLRSKVHLRLPLCSVLRSCARQGCLVAAVLLCVQLLSVSDVAALHTTHLQTAVFALMHVYKLALCACTCKEIILESQEKSTKPSRELTENQCSVLERRHGRRSLYSSDIAIIAEDESDVSLGKETTKLERQSEIIGSKRRILNFSSDDAFSDDKSFKCGCNGVAMIGSRTEMNSNDDRTSNLEKNFLCEDSIPSTENCSNSFENSNNAIATSGHDFKISHHGVNSIQMKGREESSCSKSLDSHFSSVCQHMPQENVQDREDVFSTRNPINCNEIYFSQSCHHHHHMPGSARTKSSFSGEVSLFLRLLLGWLFDLPVFPDGLFYAELPNTSIDIKEYKMTVAVINEHYTSPCSLRCASHLSSNFHVHESTRNQERPSNFSKTPSKKKISNHKNPQSVPQILNHQRPVSPNKSVLRADPHVQHIYQSVQDSKCKCTNLNKCGSLNCQRSESNFQSEMHLRHNTCDVPSRNRSVTYNTAEGVENRIICSDEHCSNGTNVMPINDANSHHLCNQDHSNSNIPLKYDSKYAVLCHDINSPVSSQFASACNITKQEEDCYPVYGDADATSSINTRVNSVTEPPRCFVTPLKCRTRDNVTAVTSPDVTMTLTDTPHRGEELVEGVCPPSPPPAPHRFDEHIRVDSHLLKEWCPQLAPLQGMLRNALDGSGDRASHGSVRKIAPLSALPHRRQPDSPSATTDGSASEGKKPSNKQDLSQHSLQNQLEESFFHQQPACVRECVTFVIDHLTTNCLRHLRTTLLPAAVAFATRDLQDRFDSEFGLHESSALEPEISIQDCAKFSSTDEVEAVAKRELLQALTSLRGQVAQQCVQHLQQQLHQQQQLLRMLLPSDISDKAVAVCCGVVVRSCSERVTAWLRNDLVPTTPPSLFSPVTRTTLRRVLTKLDLNVTPNWSLTSFLEAATCEIASPAMGVVTVPAFDVSQTVATITANVNSIDGSQPIQSPVNCRKIITSATTDLDFPNNLTLAKAASTDANISASISSVLVGKSPTDLCSNLHSAPISNTGTSGSFSFMISSSIVPAIAYAYSSCTSSSYCVSTLSSSNSVSSCTTVVAANQSSSSTGAALAPSIPISCGTLFNARTKFNSTEIKDNSSCGLFSPANECVADKSQSPVLSNSNFIISHEENAAKSSNRQNRFLKDVDFNSSGLLDYTLDLANISATNVFAEDKAAFAHVSCGKEMHDKDAPVPSLLKIEMKALAKALLNSLTIPGLPQFKSYLRQPYSTTTSCQESAVDLPVRTHNGVLRELSNVAPPLPVTAEQLRVLAVALRDCVTRRADITSPLLRGFKTLSVDIITTACAAYPDLVTPSVLDDYIALWGPDAPLESPPSLPTTVLAPRVLHLIELRSRSGEVCSSKGLQQLLHACVDASLLQREMLHDKAVALLQHSWLPVVLQELSSLVQSLCDAQDDDAVVSFLPWLCQEMENLSDPE
ncbi:uncharacterized protein LOC108679817 [Hyalella azteca]|uniref:Uncharacterized protein LOC108679817 n=1 Tax=Hyalella azteca TaxID=294128 RepID=A0A8B7PD61_HYAAZ|nr:uncharacterized protein LOC108679817 [Hyalella azteca]XP_018024034.1 uncharacterized protein LOC108679817 [Hyalella azteca]